MDDSSRTGANPDSRDHSADASPKDKPKTEMTAAASVAVPDFELYKRIGRGSYGQVWLAKSATGAYRAVKLVFRADFDADKPYEREFKGIREFEPISRSHPGQLDILHVGRNEAEGFFYYVMELADDETGDYETQAPTKAQTSTRHSSLTETASTRRNVDPQSYEPRTLQSLLKRRDRLRPGECLEIAVVLTEALGHLHANQLVHRDIKPSNIIFVRGSPKLADIGLVAQADEQLSIVGTEGFLPPEGPGKRTADIYSLGKVFYEMATGYDRRDFPKPPKAFEDKWDHRAFVEFNEVILKCCESAVEQRYASTADLLTDLNLLRQGRSVRRLRLFEKRFQTFRRISLAVASLALVATAAFFYQQAQTREARRLASENQELARGEREQHERAEISLRHFKLQRVEEMLESGDSGQALAEMAQRLREHPDDPLVGPRLLSALTYRNFALPLAEMAHDASVTALAMSSSGKYLASGTLTGAVRLWTLPTGRLIAELEGAETKIAGLDFDGEGRRLVSSAKSGQVKLWQIDESVVTLLTTIQVGSRLNRVCFHPDGRTVAVGANDRSLCLFDCETGEKTASLRHERSGVNDVRFTQDGKKLITHTGKQMDVWDVASREHLWSVVDDDNKPNLEGFENGQGESLALHHDGLRFVSQAYGAERTRLRIRNLQNKATVLGRSEHRLAITCAEFSPQGSSVATGSLDQHLRIWDAETGHALTDPILHGGVVTLVRFSPNGNLVASCSRNHTIRLWDASSGQAVSEPLHHGSKLCELRFSPDGKQLVTCDENTIRVWDIRPGEARASVLHHASSANEKWIVQAAFLPGGDRIVTTVRDMIWAPGPWYPRRWPGIESRMHVRFWDPTSGKPASPKLMVNPGTASWRGTYFIDYARETDRMLVGHYEALHVMRVADGTIIQRFDHGFSDFRTHAIRNRSRMLAGGTQVIMPMTESDGKVVVAILDVATGNRLRAFEHGTPTSPDFHLSHNEKWLSIMGEETGELWDIEQGTLLREGPVGPFSPDDRFMHVSDDGAPISRVIEARSGQPVHEAVPEDSSFPPRIFSPDSRYFVVCSSPATATILDLDTGEKVTPHLGHDWLVDDLDFSPDTKRLGTASWDQTVRLWDVKSGLSVSEPFRHDGLVHSLDYHPSDPRWLVTGTTAGNARLWEVIDFEASVPEWVLGLAETLGGKRISDRHHDLSAEDLFALKRNLLADPSDDYFTRWGRWFFSDREQRSISPSSEVPMPVYLARRLNEDSLLQGSSLREALGYSPMDAARLARLGRKYFVHKYYSDDERDFERAEWYTRLALQVDPNLATAWWARAEVLHGLGRSQEALQHSVQACLLDPDDPNAWYVRSSIQREIGDELPAMIAYLKALDLIVWRPHEEIFESLPYLHENLLPHIDTSHGATHLARMESIDGWGLNPHQRLEGSWLTATLPLWRMLFTQNLAAGGAASSRPADWIQELACPDGNAWIETLGGRNALTVVKAALVARIIADASEGGSLPESDIAVEPVLQRLMLASPADALIPQGAKWRYFEEGRDPGNGWFRPSFDDSSWQTGEAPLGFGEQAHATILGKTTADKSPLLTCYFRREFDLSQAEEAGQAALSIHLLCDDGALVYLNGEEIYRANMPEGKLAYHTLANMTVGGEAETVFLEVQIDRQKLRAGRNVIAVEVHQQNPGSSDLNFDLALAWHRSQLEPGEAFPILTQLDTILPASFGKPWRRHWKFAFFPSTGDTASSEGGATPSLEAWNFRARVQALMKNWTESLSAIDTILSLETNADSLAKIQSMKAMIIEQMSKP